MTISIIDIARPAPEVFAYVTDPRRFHEWQAGVVSGQMKEPGETAVGSHCVTTRRIGGAKRSSTSVVTTMNPPTNWAVSGIDGPIRARVNVTVQPLEETKSRVRIDVAFTGYGLGKVLVPLVVQRQAAKEMPANCRRLKERLESTD